MDSRLVRKLSISFLVFFLLYVLFFSTVDGDGSRRQFKNTPLDDMVWRFILGVRNCLRDRTENFEYLSNKFAQYWRSLPAISDTCGVNPQMSIRAYSTKHSFNLYFIPNMNRSTENEKCTVISYVGKNFPELEPKLKKENPSCRVFNYGNDDLTKRMQAFERVNALYIRPNVARISDVIDFLNSDAATVCQINLLYPEPFARLEHQFVADFNHFLTDGKYLLLKAEKGFTSTFMNLFLVNFSDEYCRKRYFRMYTFD